MSCNTTCYKRDTCNTKWHRVATFKVPARAMTNKRSESKFGDLFPTIKDCILKLNHPYTFA
eukprot:5952140-Pleurochrysis_carterae.AAC.1